MEKDKKAAVIMRWFFFRPLFVGVLLCIAGLGAVSVPLFTDADTTSVSVTVVYFECNDGIDNDSDGFTDYPDDSDCDSATDDNETAELFACSDGIDNDSDGKIDYPNDPGCSSETDDSETNLSSSGGGSGGGSFPLSATVIDFVGLAHPFAAVSLLHNGSIVATEIADADGRFRITVSLRAGGTEIFNLYARDRNGVRSANVALALDIERSASVTAQNILLPPTLALRGSAGGPNALIASGYSVPEARVRFHFTPVRSGIFEVEAGADGAYEAVLGPSQFSQEGPYSVSASAFSGSLSSSPAFSLQFFIEEGEFIILPRDEERLEPKKPAAAADLNGDDAINIVDFSILIYWFGQSSFPTAVDLNRDGAVDIVDFSILAYYWTG